MKLDVHIEKTSLTDQGGSPNRGSDRLPVQWLRISAAAVCCLVVKEIAKFSTVVITIGDTDIDTDTERLLNLRVRGVCPRGCLRHQALDRRCLPSCLRVAEAKRQHKATQQVFESDCL